MSSPRSTKPEPPGGSGRGVMQMDGAAEPSHPRRIVLTGGPGAGKTAVLELVRQSFSERVCVLPEAASILFGGGFPRGAAPGERRAAQRAIFAVQRELEAWGAEQAADFVLCDRGTVDGAAYWPGPDTLWDQVGTSREAEFARYEVVIHMRTPPLGNGYNHQNPLRRESAEEASRIDQRIAAAWTGHPRYVVVESASEFVLKAERAIQAVREALPASCWRRRG
jgi:predicted ATPase